MLSVLCNGQQRYLHSFPTRRSSDLAVGGDVDGVAEMAEEPGGEIERSERGPRAALARLGAKRRVGAEQGAAVVGLPEQDRKSTRLNSSHLGISYAVFCLKK